MFVSGQVIDRSIHLMLSESTFVCGIQVFLSLPQKDVEIKQPLMETLPDEDVEEAPALVWDGMAF